VLDNYATHKIPAIREWLVKHPPASTCTSPRPAQAGSTWSSAGCPS
jgi:hypothetical protein